MFFVVIFIAAANFLHASEDEYTVFATDTQNCFIAQAGDKLYVNSKAIIITSDHFYLNVGDHLMSVSGLFADERGIFLSKNRESEKTWTCPVCGFENSYNSPICSNLRNHFKYEPEHR